MTEEVEEGEELQDSDVLKIAHPGAANRQRERMEPANGLAVEIPSRSTGWEFRSAWRQKDPPTFQSRLLLLDGGLYNLARRHRSFATSCERLAVGSPCRTAGQTGSRLGGAAGRKEVRKRLGGITSPPDPLRSWRTEAAIAAPHWLRRHFISSAAESHRCSRRFPPLPSPGLLY